MKSRLEIVLHQINRQKLFIATLLSVIIVALYGKTYHYGFVMDDGIVWSQNQFVLKGFAGIKDIFSTDAFEGYLKNLGVSPMAMGGGRYRPLSLALFAILNQFFGTNPTAGHIANIVIYIFSAFVLFVFVSRLLDFYAVENSKAKALLATLIFILHPVHTEVVANIKSIDENMCFLLGMLALVILLAADTASKSIWKLVLADICMLASLLAKETSIVLIPIYILLLWRFNGLNALLNATKKASPLMIAFAVYMAFRVNAVGWGSGHHTLEENLLNNPFLKMDATRAMLPFSFSEKAAAIFLGLLKYLQLLVFPARLTHDYYPRYFPVTDFTGNGLAILSLLLHVGLVYLLFYYRKSGKIFSFLIAFYLISILIFSNIFFNIGVNLAERFLFLPSVAWAVLLSLLLFLLKKKKSLAMLSNILLLLILGFYSVQTFARSGAWESDYTLATTDVKTSDNSVRALAFAASELLIKNNKSRTPNKEELQEAIGYIEKSILLYPYAVDNYVTAANLYQINENWDKAIYYYEFLLARKVQNPDISKNLPTCYLEAGKKLSEENNAADGLAYIKKAWQYSQNLEIKRALGIAYARNFQYREAEIILSDVLKVSPQDTVVETYLGILREKNNHTPVKH